MFRLIYMLAICLFLHGFIKLVAQDERIVKPVVEEGDLKKLEKANSFREEGNKLVEEANVLNLEVFTIQANAAFDEKSIKKKTNHLESQAKQKQIQASGLYEKCNEIKFIVYKKYLDGFWETHSGEESDYLNARLLEEQSCDNYFQAVSYRIDAKQMDDDFSKLEKLTEANDLEIQAIQKQVTALADYYGLARTGSDRQTPADVPEEVSDMETTIPQPLEINQEMIDRYNSYIAAGQLTDTSLSTGRISGITEFETGKLLQLWYDYVYGHYVSENEYAFAANEDTLQGNVLSEHTAAKGAKPVEIGIVTDVNKERIIPSDEEVIYRLQLAANRNELSQRALGKMYYGNKQVEMINDNGWYKYSIGDFDSYEDASRFRESSSINNAFIVAYLKGSRFKKEPLITEIMTQVGYVPEGEQRLPAGLIFRIQIAASRVPITIEQLKRIYSGNYPVEMIVEENWYKYQLMGVRLFSDAQHILKNIQVKGIFIVAYENGLKTNLTEAVTRNLELEELFQSRGRKGVMNEIEYHLQIAASRIAMKPDELKALYSGSEAISIILEDGWFKYHLKAGNSTEMAEKFKRDCGVDKAFIVPYRRAVKITYFEAIKENK